MRALLPASSACGAGMSTNGKDKSGRVCIRCSAATESGTCSAPKTFYLDTVESAVLSGLRAELSAPKVIAEYVRTYLEERKRLAITSNGKRQRLEQPLRQLNREIERLVDAIAKGHGDPSILGPRSTALGAERERIKDAYCRFGPAICPTRERRAIARWYSQNQRSWYCFKSAHRASIRHDQRQMQLRPVARRF